MLLSCTALGVVVGLLGVAGVFATSSDRATTGQNDARSGDLPQPEPAVDLELAHASGINSLSGQVTCGDDWSGDLTTGVLTSDGVSLAGDGLSGDSDYGSVCIRNVGTLGALYSVRALDLVDSELSCAPGEAAADTTCGSGAGELSSQLLTDVRHVKQGTRPCSYANRAAPYLRALATTEAASVGYLAPGEVDAVCLQVRWVPTDASQSDRASWRYAFDGTEHTCADANEPNDEFSAATVVAGAISTSGMICPGDTDLYRITTGPQALTVELGGYVGDDDHLALLVRQTSGSLVASSAGNTGGQRVTVPASGTYLLEVRPTFAAGETPYVLGSYVLP